MEYALYLGCNIPLKFPHFESAFREVMALLGFNFKEMNGASCCSDPVVSQSLSVDTWMTIAARNLAIAEKMGLDVVTVCSGCFETLKTVYTLLEEDEEAKKRVNSVLSGIGYEYKGTSKVYHIVELLGKEDMLEKIKSTVKKPLEDLNVAVHYSCHLLRPSEILEVDHPEKPQVMDKIVEALGAKSIDYPEKMECCGYCARVNEDIGFKQVEMKITALKKLDVDALTAVCPACIGQYDRKEKLLARKTGKELDIPVLFLPELMAIAFGVDMEKLNLKQRTVKPTKLLEKLKI